MFRSFITSGRIRVIFAILPALLAVACSSPPPRAIVIPDAGSYELLPSAVFARSMAITQSVTISGKNPQQFLLQTEVEPEGLSMVGLTGFGQKLFELQYVRNTLNVKKTPFLPGSLVPEKLLADFQLIYWPAALLRQLFRDSSIELLETVSEQGQQRLLRQGTATLVEILYQPSPGIEHGLVYRNPRQGYTMHIEVLSTVTR